jgi:cytochrome d ubiquinol oxidase subunit II
VLAVVAVAYLSSVFLVTDAGRVADHDMVEYFRRRAVIAAVVAGVVALAGIAVIHADARYLFDGLTSRALPLVLVSAIGGLASLGLLLRGEHPSARIAAIGAVGGIVAAWGVAQWPYVIPTSMTVEATAAADGTLQATIVVFVLACVFILPALGLLYALDQRGILPEEGVDEEPDEATVPAPG